MLAMSIELARTPSAGVRNSGRGTGQPQGVAQWERRGGTHPSVSHLVHIALSTRVRFEWLATGRGVCKASGEELTVSTPTQDYVRDDLEGNVLSLLRRLPPRKRQVAQSIIEMLVV